VISVGTEQSAVFSKVYRIKKCSWC